MRPRTLRTTRDTIALLAVDALLRGLARTVIPVRVRAPLATAVMLVRFDAAGVELGRAALRREGDDWVGEVAAGTIYGLVADGDGPRFDPSKVLLDPQATDVCFPPGHDRKRGPPARRRQRRPRPPGDRPPAATAAGRPAARRGRPSSTRPTSAASPAALAVDRPGTFAALGTQLPRLAALGITVIELLPVHQNDPQEGSYWGYMPLAFGAVHRQYAAGDDAAAELAAFVAAAHEHDIEVWLDVVFNHTTEVDATGPTYNLRGLSDGAYYRLHDDGSYIETTGCGNDIDAASPAAQDLVVWALDRLADLGVDGFRFDLAAVLGRHDAVHRPPRRVGARRVAWRWSPSRGTPSAPTSSDGPGPGDGWMQWNDRFREDVRGFLRGEEGLVAALAAARAGQPRPLRRADAQRQLRRPATTGSRCTTSSPTTASTTRPTATATTTEPASNRSWNCGWEGDVDVPDEVARAAAPPAAQRLVPAGDGPRRADGGHGRRGRAHPGRQQQRLQPGQRDVVVRLGAGRRASPTSSGSCGKLLALRDRHPILSQPAWWGDAVQFFGTVGRGRPRSALAVARLVRRRPLRHRQRLVGAAWSSTIQRPGRWRRVVDTSLLPPDDIVDDDDAVPVGQSYDVGPRSVVILIRR